jgi:type VI secretion system secreted protein VgrG
MWAGKKWGWQFIPRIGMEVVVEFLEGDPDRPLVVGTVYNGEYKHPTTCE